MTERTGEQAGGGARVEDRGGPLGERAREIDVGAEARGLREEQAWQREGHAARTLVENDSLRLVLVDLRRGARVGEHRTGAPISIHVLTGRVSVHVAGRSHALAAGQVLALDESLPHDVEALEPSTFLLTLPRPRHEAGAGTH